MRVVIGFDIFDAEDPHKRLEGKELEAVVDDDIRRFEEFFTAEVDSSGPLSGPEKAIIKTYLYWKTHDGNTPAEKAAHEETQDATS